MSDQAPHQHSRREFLRAGAVSMGATLCGTSLASVSATPTSRLSEIHDLSACQIRDLLRSHEISPVEVIQAFLNRIEQVEPHINAVNHSPDPQSLLALAKQAEGKILRDEVDWNETPLLGVPVSIKDMYEVEGMPVTAGARVNKDNIAKSDATAVSKLRKAGAIIHAITNTPLYHAAFETSNLLHGRTNNPFDLDRTPGGSSGGEAALIAAGGSPWGLGGDSGGSIRVPAHFCGIAGLAPAWGRVSTAGNVPAIYNSGPFYLRCGPMARHVEDLSLMLPIISGQDDRDPFTFPMTLGDPDRVSMHRLKVAYCTEALKIKPRKEIQDAIERAALSLRGDVASVTKEVPPNYDSQDPLKLEASFTVRGGTEPQKAMLRELGEEDDELRQEGIRRIDDWLKTQDAAELEEQAAKLPQLHAAMNQFMLEYDVLLCPVTTDVAYQHGTSWESILKTGMFFVNMFNMYGNLPLGVVRCGTSAEGLPFGVQVVGPSYREDIVLAVMQHLENKLKAWQPPSETNLGGK